jgi:hypothetical protein
MLRSYLLSYHNDCVIINRALLPPKRGGRMHHAACATTNYVPPPRPLIPTPCAQQNYSAAPARHSSLITPHVLIGSHQLLEFRLIRSQQTRKHFLTGGFSARLANGAALATQQSQLTTRGFSIASEIKSKTNPTCSKQTSKYFSIAIFACFWRTPATSPTTDPRITIFLTATHPDSGIPQPHESKRETIF